ncbi:MAG: SCP2 sterol-binding domain-containing protein [Nevskia sp.]|nr:SCP2 sterol-binding domain-containing protein [Nevskia sp.]
MFSNEYPSRSIKMTAEEMLQHLPAAFNPAAAHGVEAVLQFNASKPHYATISNGACSVAAGTASKPDVTLNIDDDNLVKLMKGELNGVTAFLTGKLRLNGDLGLAQRISSFFDASRLL